MLQRNCQNRFRVVCDLDVYHVMKMSRAAHSCMFYQCRTLFGLSFLVTAIVSLKGWQILEFFF